MKIEVLNFHLSELVTLNLFEYLNKTYTEKVFIRAFVYSLYFDTLSIEVLFL